jgi:hypothetical protein
MGDGSFVGSEREPGVKLSSGFFGSDKSLVGGGTAPSVLRLFGAEPDAKSGSSMSWGGFFRLTESLPDPSPPTGALSLDTFLIRIGAAFFSCAGGGIGGDGLAGKDARGGSLSFMRTSTGPDFPRGAAGAGEGEGLWLSGLGTLDILKPDPGTLRDAAAAAALVPSSTSLPLVLTRGAGLLSSLMRISAFGSGFGFDFFSFASLDDTPRFGASGLTAARLAAVGLEGAASEAIIELSAPFR